MKKLTSFAFAFLFWVLISFGQAGDPVLSARIISPDSLVNIYQASFGNNQPFYNGKQFYGYSQLIKGHAFYPVNNWITGSILFDNIWYDNVSIMYDVYTDNVVVRHPNGVQVILIGDRVQEFLIDGRVFVHLYPDKDRGITHAGFYQRLIEGKATVFARRVKILEEKIDGLELERKFVSQDVLYILKDNIYTRIKKQQSLPAIFKDKRLELKSYFSRGRKKYKEGPEGYITSMAAFYNKLYQ